MLTPNHRQEGLCRAYIQAVAARCGMSWSSPQPDYGIDMTLHDIIQLGGHLTQSGYDIDFQAKATTRGRIQAQHVSCDIEATTYNAMRLPFRATPRLLVVLFLPRHEMDWISWTEEALLVRRCAYWVSLRSLPSTSNRRSVRLTIPRANVFSPESLSAIMDRFKRGEKL